VLSAHRKKQKTQKEHYLIECAKFRRWVAMMLTRLSLFSLCGSMDLSISKHSDERGGEVALFVVLGIFLLDKLLGVLISRFERIYHYLSFLL
jgi:hypothetical protein